MPVDGTHVCLTCGEWSYHLAAHECNAPLEPYQAFDHPRRETLAEMIERDQERRAQGPWVPGCGGTEEPFTTRTRRRLLYCWQPSTGRHAYLDCETDTILTDDESRSALAMY